MKSITKDDLRIMSAALAAWNGAKVNLTAAEWERAEALLEGME